VLERSARNQKELIESRSAGIIKKEGINERLIAFPTMGGSSKSSDKEPSPEGSEPDKLTTKGKKNVRKVDERTVNP